MKEFNTLGEALTVLETSQNREQRALAYILRQTVLFDYDLDFTDDPEPEEETKPKSFWRSIGELFGF